MNIERRFHAAPLQLNHADEQRKIVGYAAVFNSFSEDLGGFTERILPGAFSDSLKKQDVRALVDHDSRLILGRTTANTLTLAEDDQGLRATILPPWENSYAADLQRSIERGDISGMSFAFETLADDWAVENGKVIRTLRNIRLHEVSVVTFPAYPDTAVAVRHLRQFQRDNLLIPKLRLRLLEAM